MASSRDLSFNQAGTRIRDRSLVCAKCFRSNPTRIKLITTECFAGEHHAHERRVRVVWTGKRLEEVRRGAPPTRPMPKTWLKGGFVLCDGNRCIGERCTYAHSIEERDDWNHERGWKIPSNYPPLSPCQPTSMRRPRVSLPPIPPLSPSTKSRSEVAAQGIRPSQTSTQTCPEQEVSLQPATQIQQQRIPQQPLTSETTTFPSTSVSLGQQPPTLESYFHFPSTSPLQPDMRPVESSLAQSTGHGLPSSFLPTFPEGATLLQSLQLEEQPKYPDLGVQLPLLPEFGVKPAQSPPGRHPQRSILLELFSADIDYAASKLKFHERLKENLRIEDIEEKLTRGNYEEKFHKLLCWEEKAHIEILDERCDGNYTLIVQQAGIKKPQWMYDAKPTHKRFGYLLGLIGDKITYATQASEGAILVVQKGIVEIKAEILRENYDHTEERLYVAFDQQSLLQLKSDLDVPNAQCTRYVKVEFELKHSYFNNLHKSLTNLPEEVISRIMPRKDDFVPVQVQQIPPHYRSSLKLYKCSSDQLHALQLVVSCPSQGPPVLIAGPFGTGKTRLLATAAHYFFKESKSRNRNFRILACTQQQVSADTLLECYFDLMIKEEKDPYIIRLHTQAYRSKNLNLKQWCKTVSQFRRDFERSSHSNKSQFLIVTTCQTSLHLADIVPCGFFTHILIDEGAQMREPEAVAPLCLAGERTKIVIAGDQNQVGPAMLVLGDEARKNGLAVSLLERLHEAYKELGEVTRNYHASLRTNYRCHSGILNLAEMFYESSLECDPSTENTTHPLVTFPLCFVCSSVDDTQMCIDSATDSDEAEIVLTQVTNYADSWPVNGWGSKDLSQVCFISSSRSQLNVARRLSKQHGAPQKLREVWRVPTYDIQGREFRAIFISTSEPTWKNGETCNPTKSICDRYVFNTVITRARSLVVSVGNPTMLLQMEKHMIRKYGSKGKCWSKYLKLCLDHNTLSINSSLKMSKAQKQKYKKKLQQLVEKQLTMSPTGSEIASIEPATQQKLPQVPKLAVPDTSTCQSEEGSSQAIPHVPVQVKVKSPDHESAAKESTTLKLGKEFDVKECLGKGGFGQVYCARNLLDDQDYAVKIIKLRDQKSKSEKVRREVKALAKLEHHHIVRYYGSWIEKAPAWWMERAAQKSSGSLLSPGQSLTVTEIHVQDSSSHTPPSSASTPSGSTETSVGAALAESSTACSLEIVFEKEESHRAQSDEEPRSKLPPQRSTAHHEIVSQPPTCLFIQTELCKKETLKDWLKNNIENRARKKVMRLFNQILEAVQYIHKLGFMHRDLKPSNIFFSLKSDDLIKIGDFGLVAGNIASDPMALTPEKHQEHVSSSFAGTPLYMAPEQLEGHDYTNKVDVFALGVIFCELNCPFSSGMKMEKQKVLGAARQQKFPDKVDEFNFLAEFIKWLLDPNPDTRPSAAEVYKSPKLTELRKSFRTSEIEHVPVV